MAKKSSKATEENQEQAKTIQENPEETLGTANSTSAVKTTADNLLPKEKKESLQETEEIAAKSIEPVTKSGDSLTSTERKVKLRDLNTQYVDPINGWTLSGEEEKELPEYPSQDTLERIKSGFIVKV